MRGGALKVMESQGYHARLAGAPLDANPHARMRVPGTRPEMSAQAAEAWERGWRTADDEIRGTARRA
ncbi:MAG: ribosome modulation factor [Gemmatimonadaceae bacterium]